MTTSSDETRQHEATIEILKMALTIAILKRRQQRDQIGLIFAIWLIVHFVSFCSEVDYIFRLLILRLRRCINFDKKVLGYIFGYIFCELITITSPLRT
jgi:hypothetical protein